MSSKSTTFTPEEQAKIDAEVKAYQERVKQDQIDAVIRNKILDDQRKQPGYKYY